jgi:uncharacterized phage protein (TIGR02218 family)
MTFDTLEASNYDGKPIALYEFARSPVTWRYCSADTDIIHDSNSYKSVPISNSGIPQSGDPAADDVTIEMPSAEAIAGLFQGTPPSDTLTVTIRLLHYGDTESRVIWIGTVAAVSRGADESSCRIVCKNLGASFEAAGVRIGWSRMCPYVLYDLATCKVAKNSFRIAASPSAAVGRVLTVPTVGTYADGEFAGGFIEWTTIDGATERRGITDHTGTALTLYGLTDGVPTGSAIYIYYGCNRTPERCQEKFANLANYGGIPGLPGVSPFQGRQNF